MSAPTDVRLQMTLLYKHMFQGGNTGGFLLYVDLLLIVTPIVGICNCFLCFVVGYFVSILVLQ